jgi:hypothetical protein
MTSQVSIRPTAIPSFSTAELIRSDLNDPLLRPKFHDRILVLRSPAGTLELPVKHLDGWVPITTPSKSLFCTTSSTPVVKLRAD